MRKICSRFVVVGADGYVSLPAAAETVTIRHLLTHTSGLWDAALYDGRLLPLAAGDLGGEGAVRGQIQRWATACLRPTAESTSASPAQAVVLGVRGNVEWRSVFSLSVDAFTDAFIGARWSLGPCVAFVVRSLRNDVFCEHCA